MHQSSQTSSPSLFYQRPPNESRPSTRFPNRKANLSKTTTPTLHQNNNNMSVGFYQLAQQPKDPQLLQQPILNSINSACRAHRTVSSRMAMGREYISQQPSPSTYFLHPRVAAKKRKLRTKKRQRKQNECSFRPTPTIGSYGFVRYEALKKRYEQLEKVVARKNIDTLEGQFFHKFDVFAAKEKRLRQQERLRSLSYIIR